MSEPWWRHAVIYQIYPRSFADSTGDGVGDLQGVRAHLDYVAALGVDAIWLSPFYKSPQFDAGYDVADYRDVDPLFGSLQDFDDLLVAAHERELRVVIDMVPNHTSSEHPWFQAALAAAPGSPERARYIFRDGTGPNGNEPPNNWVSRFGGTCAWQRVPDGQWYLHIYAVQQPDLNWANAEVVDEFKSILRFWLDRGVDGFRIDVAHGLVKDQSFRDLTASQHERRIQGPGFEPAHPHWDQDGVHTIYEGWREVLNEYPGDRVSVAEAWVQMPQRLAAYVRPTELNTAFNFDYLNAGWNAAAVRHVIDSTLASMGAVGAPATWVLSNHDVTRLPTRYGGGALGLRRGRAVMLLTFALPGGAYVYQGEELGLPEVVDIPDNERQDPTFFQSGGRVKGRDGCRVPLPWSGTKPPFGFGPEGSHPWLPQPVEWASQTAEVQSAQALSTLSFYRDALSLRHQLDALGDGTLEWIETTGDVLAFTRSPGFALAINFGDEDAPLPAELQSSPALLTSEWQQPGMIAANSCIWFRHHV